MSRGCGCGKSAFNRAGKAVEAARRIRRSPDAAETVPVRAYPCPDGNGWHLTSQPGDTDRHPGNRSPRGRHR